MPVHGAGGVNVVVRGLKGKEVMTVAEAEVTVVAAIVVIGRYLECLSTSLSQLSKPGVNRSA
jgi:hypothetical protein